MAVTFYVSTAGQAIVTCLSTDTKPTSMPDNWVLFELNTARRFKSTGGAWVQANVTEWGSIEGAVANQTDLQAELDAKAVLPVSQSDVTGLVSALAAKEDDSNKGVANGYAGLDAGGLVPLAQLPTGLPSAWGVITGVLSAQTDLQSALDAKEATANKGIASGYAGLDGAVKVPIAQLPTGSSSTTVCIGNDARLSDARTPTAHASTHNAGGADVMAIDSAAATGSLRTLGSGAAQACGGTDARLSDARTPLTHATSHKSGGSDAVKLDELAAPTDITTLNATTAIHGLLRKLDGLTTTFLRGDGAWAVPPAGGGASATTVEPNLGTTATWRGKFTITDAAIGPTSKVLCWQAPGPYTGKGTLADEAEMQPVAVIAVVPASGSAIVHWETPPYVTMQPVIADGRRATPTVTQDIMRIPQLIPTRLGKVRGNVKFTYMVLA